jgi:hypothetical protein
MAKDQQFRRSEHVPILRGARCVVDPGKDVQALLFDDGFEAIHGRCRA